MSVDVDVLADIGRRAGLSAVGFCRAEPFSHTAEVLRRRKEAGLHGGMQFTYRNPGRSTDPSRLLPGAATLVVGALEFDARDCDRPDGSPADDGRPGSHRADSGGSGDDGRAGDHRPGNGGPFARVAAYARHDYYTPLRAALEAVAEVLRAEGYRTVVSADENGLVDRAAAHRAGIGWWGKNSNLLVPGFGSLVVLGAVVTDAPVVHADPATVADGCGSCRQCLDGCPTGAIVAPGTVDARRCLAWLVQADGVFDPDYRIALGDRIYGCDDCSEVCPPNRVRVRRRTGGGSGQWVSVLDMLDASDDELLDAYGRWYIPRRQPRYLRRNALVVLGNAGEPSDPRTRLAVERALGDPDPLVRAHAVWCARRLGLGLDALSGRDDPLVRAELERPVPPRRPPA